MKVSMSPEQATKLAALLAGTKDASLQGLARKVEQGQKANIQVTAYEWRAIEVALLEWVRMTQPIVDSMPATLRLKHEGPDSALGLVKAALPKVEQLKDRTAAREAAGG